jgi:hypothetical protein
MTNHFEEKRKIADEKALNEQRIIAGWRDAASERRQIRAFVEAPVKDAFLLYGLLDSAGSAWNGRELSSWEHYRPRLFAHVEDTQEAYHYLYKNGWIEPSLNTPPNAFSVDSAGGVRFEWARVKWTLCPESANGSPVAVLQLLEDAMNNGTTAEVAELWRWVCMSELREHFESIRRRFSFHSEGWPGALEQTVEQLLDRFSVRQLFGIIWNSCKNIGWQRSDSHYPKGRGRNSISGNLRQTVDRLRASGRPVEAWWTRPGPEREARYTGLLFDRLLVGGDEFYESLTGAKLRDLQRGATASSHHEEAES